MDETTALLTRPLLGDGKEDEIAAVKFGQECKIIACNALPVFCSQILELSLVFVSVFTLGHLSTTALAAISVATMIANITGLSMIQGLCSALDTLLPSAWTSDQPYLVGLWAQRIALIVAVQVVLILGVWLNSEGILLMLKQEPEIASLAAQYLRWASLGLPAYGGVSIMRRYFQAQGLFSVNTKLTIIASPINVILNYTLVHGSPFAYFPLSGLGFIGAPISTVTCQYILLFLNLGYAYFFTDGRAYHPPSILAFHHLDTVLKLGVGGIGQIAGGWWAWELVGLVASWLGPTSMAAQGVLLTSKVIMDQLVVGVSASADMRIGNLLGEKRAGRARFTMWAALGLGVIASGCACFTLLLFRNSWGSLFVADPSVIELVSSILPIIALFQLVDGNSTVTAAIMRAKGQQSIGAVLIVTAYYLVGLPVGVWLAFKAPRMGGAGEKGWGLIGLWYGLGMGLVYTAFVGTWVVLRTDWKEEVEKVTRRLKAEGRRQGGLLE